MLRLIPPPEEHSPLKKQKQNLSNLMVTLRKQSDSWKTFVLEVQLTVNKKYFSRLPTAYSLLEKTENYEKRNPGENLRKL